MGHFDRSVGGDGDLIGELLRGSGLDWRRVLGAETGEFGENRLCF